jgi:hypothetical protein
MSYTIFHYESLIETYDKVFLRFMESLKISLGKPRRSWGNNIQMDLREIGLEGVDWIHLAKDGDRWQALVTTIINFLVP